MNPLNILGLLKCADCGRREYLVQGLCVDCWYERYGKGKHIWEIWEMLGYETPQRIRRKIEEIKRLMGEEPEVYK